MIWKSIQHRQRAPWSLALPAAAVLTALCTVPGWAGQLPDNTAVPGDAWAGSGASHLQSQELIAAARRFAPDSQRNTGASPALGALIAEALRSNPELRAAAKETEAADQRVRPAGALEDPMLEVGLLNAPIQPFSLSSEDMTMKMLGLSQKLPYPGKRALREQVAAK